MMVGVFFSLWREPGTVLDSVASLCYARLITTIRVVPFQTKKILFCEICSIKMSYLGYTATI